MAEAKLNFSIRETPYSRGLRLSVVGELDIASVPILEQRLERLRIEGRDVRLDLSKLQFIDSTGLRLLIVTVRNGSTEGWRFEIEPNVAPQPMRLFRLVSLDRHLGDGR
jgi:anti-sigma B factor antagonist